MLCSAVLCSAVRRATLRYAALRCPALRSAALRRTALRCAAPRHAAVANGTFHLLSHFCISRFPLTTTRPSASIYCHSLRSRCSAQRLAAPSLCTPLIRPPTPAPRLFSTRARQPHSPVSSHPHVQQSIRPARALHSSQYPSSLYIHSVRLRRIAQLFPAVDPLRLPPSPPIARDVHHTPRVP